MEAVKNNDAGLIAKINDQLVKLGGKPLTPLEVLTNPAYFDTPAYKSLSDHCKKERLIGENVDFAKFYHDFKAGKWDKKPDSELKEAIRVFLKGGVAAINIKSENMNNLLAAVPDHNNLEGSTIDREKLISALDVGYKDLMDNILKRDSFLNNPDEMKVFLPTQQA